MKTTKLLLIFTFLGVFGYSQEVVDNEPQEVVDNEPEEGITIGVQIRPRSEYMQGTFTLPKSTDKPAFRTTQRARLKAEYTNGFLTSRISVQDIRTFGQQHHSNKVGAPSSFVHEAWFEYLLNPENKISLKVGRQELVYNNHRIFGSLDWAQQGRSHDAFVLKYEKNFNGHIGIAYYGGNFVKNKNISTDQYIDVVYNNTNMYKGMGYIWLNKTISGVDVSLLFLNVIQEKRENKTDKLVDISTEINRIAGTHIAYKSDSPFKPYIYGYYQFGNGVAYNDPISDVAHKMNAFNIGIGSDFNINKNFSIGVYGEILSGNNSDYSGGGATNRAFNPMFGTNHKFNGFMDYFYVGNHINSVGLHDAQLRLKYKKDKFSLTVDGHYFMSFADVMGSNNKTMDKYLGTELDITFSYKIAKHFSIVGGYSRMFASETMEALKGGNRNAPNNWGWLQLNVNPEIFLSL